MDKQEAKFILSALRRDEAIDCGSEEIAAAHAMLEADEELQKWYQELLAFDDIMRSKLAETPVPNQLKGDILTALKVSKPTPVRRSKARLALPIAACLCIIFGVASLWHGIHQQQLNNRVAATEFQQSMLQQINQLSGIDLRSDDPENVTAFINGEAAPLSIELQETIPSASLYGCKVIDWQGQQVTLICFTNNEVANKKPVAHLMIVDAAAIRPFKGNPDRLVNVDEDNWSSAVWKNEDHYYFLAVKEPADLELRNELPYS